jgi:hypothetical protein
MAKRWNNLAGNRFFPINSYTFILINCVHSTNSKYKQVVEYLKRAKMLHPSTFNLVFPFTHMVMCTKLVLFLNVKDTQQCDQLHIVCAPKTDRPFSWIL